MDAACAGVGLVAPLVVQHYRTGIVCHCQAAIRYRRPNRTGRVDGQRCFGGVCTRWNFWRNFGDCLNDLIYYLVIQFGLWREGLSELRQDALATLLFVVLIGAVMGIRFLLSGGWAFYG